MNIESNLPLTEATFFILLSLSQEPRHGYAILKDVETLSNGRIVFSTGTLYGALKRLMEQEWIERTDDPDPDASNRARKAYILSPYGHQILAAEVTRLQALVKAARLRSSEGQA